MTLKAWDSCMPRNGLKEADYMSIVNELREAVYTVKVHYLQQYYKCVRDTGQLHWSFATTYLEKARQLL